MRGENGWWWEEERGGNETQILAQGTDTLDAQGRTTLRAALVAPAGIVRVPAKLWPMGVGTVTSVAV